MAETKLSFSKIGITDSEFPKQCVLHYPVLWILNPQTGRAKRYDHIELKDEITKKNYQGLAETSEFVMVITEETYYSFSSLDGSVISKVPKNTIKGQIIGTQDERVLVRDNNMLHLYGKNLTLLGGRELTQEEMQQLENL